MTAPISLLPSLTGSQLPAPTIQDLSDDEQRLMNGLSNKLMAQAPHVLQRFAYYDGLQRLQNLGISIPSQLSGVRTVVDWPRICIDPLVQRAVVSGFRLPKATEVDSELAEHWRANDMDGEAPLAFLDSLTAGRGFMVVGSPDQAGDSPIITVESPLNMTVTFDPRTKQILNGYQSYEVEGMFRAVLYLPNKSIFMSRDDMVSGGWVVDDVDEHGFGEPPIVRLPNRARTSDREGRSEITPAIMNTTDSVVRTLLGMEIAREVYSIPRIALLGASEDNFVDGQGNKKTPLEMAMTKILALERDEDGELPQIHQLTAFSPAVFTEIIDEHAKLMASYTGFPPSYFGQTTTANPASADAIRVAENGIDRRAMQVQAQFNPGLRKAAQLVWRYAHSGDPLPVELRRIHVDWVDARTPTPAATTDAVAKQIAAGALPATSDVTLAELGYTPLQRAQLAQDRLLDPAMAIVTALANSIVTKLARADNAVAKDLEEGGIITASLQAALAATPLPQPPAAPQTTDGTQAGR